MGPLFVDLLDAKGHFSCFLQKVLFMGGNQKKWFFRFFFFGSKKSKNLQFSPHEIHFLVVFWTKKKTTLLMTSGQNKSQNEKFENQKKCQILKSWFYTKIPQKYFFGRIFPKKSVKSSNPSILCQKESRVYPFPSIMPILTK